jgi:hypothetical protein
MLDLPDISPLIEIAPQQPLVLDILSYTWANASLEPTQCSKVTQSITDIIPKLLLSFRDTDAVTLISFVGGVLPKLNSEVSHQLLCFLHKADPHRYCHLVPNGCLL